MTDDFTEWLKQIGMCVKVNEPLASYTTFKIGGPADNFFEAKTRDEFVGAVIAARKSHISYFVLGGGSNLLISDAGFRGLVIKNATNAITIRGMKGAIKNGEQNGSVYVEADAGTPFNSLVRFKIEEGLAGLEMHLGLPGSVGGAIFMNSKWTKPPAYVGDVVSQVILLDITNTIVMKPKEFFHFSYGKSVIQESGEIVLGVLFELTRQSKDEIWKRANESIAYRRSTQPQGVKTAGCAFKNISQADAIAAGTPNQTRSAGFLIDHAGGKQMHVGDAAVSSVHANFIVNTGKATAHDVLQLKQMIKQKVFETFHVTLQEELVVLGA